MPGHDFVGMVAGPSWIVATLDATHLLVADGPHVVVLDAEDPAELREIGRTPPLPGLPLGIDVDQRRGTAVVALSPDTVAFLSVRAPMRPVVVGAVRLTRPADVRDVTFTRDGAWVAVAAGRGGVRLLDAREPEAPVLGTALELGQPVERVVSEGNLVVALPAAAGRSEEPLDEAELERLAPAVIVIDDAGRPRSLARLRNGRVDDVRRPSMAVSDAVLHEDRVYLANCYERSQACVDRFDLRRPASPRFLGSFGVGGDAWLAVDDGRRLLYTVGITRTFRSYALSAQGTEPKLRGRIVLPRDFETGPMTLIGEHVVMAGDLGKQREPYGGFGSELPRLNWQPSGTAQTVIDVHDPADPTIAGRRDQSAERVEQLVAMGDMVLVLVDTRPRLLPRRRTVWAIDPASPGRRDVVPRLAGISALSAEGDVLHTATRANGELRVRRWAAMDPRRPVLEASAVAADPVLPEYPRMAEAPLLAEGEHGPWMAATNGAHTFAPADRSVVVAFRGQPGEPLEVTGVLTLPFAIFGMIELGEHLVLRDREALLQLDAAAARAGRLEYHARTPLPRAFRGHLGRWRDQLVLAWADLALFDLSGSVPVESARYAFERPRPHQGWHASGMVVDGDAIHLAGDEGLRTLHVTPEGLELAASTTDVPAIARRALLGDGEMPVYEGYFAFAAIAGVGERLVVERRAFWAMDAPYAPTGLTMWQVPISGAGAPRSAPPAPDTDRRRPIARESSRARPRRRCRSRCARGGCACVPSAATGPRDPR